MSQTYNYGFAPTDGPFSVPQGKASFNSKYIELLNEPTHQIGGPNVLCGIIELFESQLSIIDSIDTSGGVVYILECASYPKDYQFVRSVETELGYYDNDIPSWLWAAHYADELLYIGGTHRLDKRIDEHLGFADEDGYEASEFTKVFPPESVVGLVVNISDNNTVYELEKQVAEYWRTKKDYVYQA